MDPLRQLELSNFAIMPSNCFLIMSLFNANVLLSARFSFPSFMSHEIITRFNMVNINYINSLLDTCLVPTQRKNVTIKKYTDYLSEVIKKVYIRITLSFNIKNVYIRNLDR